MRGSRRSAFEAASVDRRLPDSRSEPDQEVVEGLGAGVRPGVPASRRDSAVKEEFAGRTEDEDFARRPGSEGAVLRSPGILPRREAGNRADLIADCAVAPRLVDLVGPEDDGMGGNRLVGPLQDGRQLGETGTGARAAGVDEHHQRETVGRQWDRSRGRPVGSRVPGLRGSHLITEDPAQTRDDADNPHSGPDVFPGRSPGPAGGRPG